MAVSSFVLQVNGGFVQKHSNPSSFHHLKAPLPSSTKPLWKVLQQTPMKVDVWNNIKKTTATMLDAFVDSMFQFVDQPLLPSQRNFGPVEEIGEAVEVDCTEGKIPMDFPEGVFIRNGPNPLFGGLKSAVSIFGRTNHTWVEGEGMLHAVYFKKNENGDWNFTYKNKNVVSETFKLEKARNKPAFIPAVEGDSLAILAAYIFNMLRFRSVNKLLNNTNVFEHSGKLYTIAENHMPLEVDMFTLDACGSWDINEAWGRPFTSHPKKAPGTGELVIMGIDAQKPFYVVGVISADGKKLNHKVDLQFDRSVISHDIGVTEKYNVIMDHPVIVDVNRLFKGGTLVKYEKDGDARIGVMPRYGEADSVQWFDVASHCTFHLLNCFEDGNEVVVRGCRSLISILPGPEFGQDKFEWFSRGFKHSKSTESNVDGSEEEGFLFSRAYEWRLNTVNGEVKERNLTGREFSMDFPAVNENFTGLKHKYGYTQVLDSTASSSCGRAKYGSLAKLYFEEACPEQSRSIPKEGLIKVEYHELAGNNFYSGILFVPKHEGTEEDDGWIISFVHNEESDISQVHIIDAKNFECEPVAKITLPQRVPYGFHGTFIPMPVEH